MAANRIPNGRCRACGVTVSSQRLYCRDCYKSRRAAQIQEHRLRTMEMNRSRARARYWANPEDMRVRTLMEKLRRRGPVADGTEDAVRILRRDPCSYCGGPGGTIDHIDPDGPSAPDNLIAACASCNRYKQRMALLSFLIARPLLERRDEIHRELVDLGLRSLRKSVPTAKRAA